MADVGKLKSEDNKSKENESDETGTESEAEDTVKDKKASGDKNKKKNNASAPAAKIKPPAKKRVKAEQAEENKKEKDKDTKKKKPASKVKEEEEDDEGDDEESDGEENGVPEKVPLLDQPLEMTGSRERKQVERFIPKEELKTAADRKVEIPDGKGKPLGEIPRIQYQLNKLKSDNLKILHRVLYDRVGQPHSIKKNIQQFKGFEFDKDSPEYKKKLNMITKIKSNPGLKSICTILDLSKSGKHAELAEKILNFLLVPEDSGKEAPDPRPKRKGISSKSYKEPKGGNEDDEAKKGKSKKDSPKKKTKPNSDEEEQEEEEEEEEEMDSDEKKTEDENEEENETAGSEEDKPKKASKRAPAKKTTTNSAPAGKKGTASSGAGSSHGKKGKEPKSEPKSESETENQSDTEDSAKEPPAKKSKTPPTDDEIKSYVKSVLEGANLEEITMKTVCKKVYEHYPDFDLGYKKEFIKNTVKSLISS